MNQRIKFIWLLSLASMLLIALGQGYWLWNQCQYKNEELLKQAHEKVLEAVVLNDSVRRLTPFKIFDDKHRYSWSYNSDVVVKEPEGRGKKPLAVWRYRITNEVKDRETSELLHADTIRLRSTSDLSPVFSTDVNKYVLEKEQPFTLARFDSCLRVVLPGVPFETSLYHSTDSLYLPFDSASLVGSRLMPTVKLRYPYDPFRQRAVDVTLRLGLPALLRAMGGQLAGSVALLLLLFVCLLYQIQTILKQQRIDELRRNFVNTMIHELRRPVQTLKMCVAFLGDKALRQDNQAMDELVHESHSELDNLSAYLQKLRDMTRADDRQTQLACTTFDLQPVVEHLVRFLHRPDDKQVEVLPTFEGDPHICADRVHMTNIISNLLENAVKYSGSSVRIEVVCRRLPKSFCITVTDNGIGIPPSEQARVFDKFYRGNHLPDRSLPGIGLGLSYVKLLVEAHGGRISLTSNPGTGTSISIEIPQ